MTLDLTFRLYRYEKGEWADISKTEKVPEIIYDTAWPGPFHFEGWHKEEFFRLGTSESLSEKDIAFLAVHEIEQASWTPEKDAYLAQFWLGSRVAVVYIKSHSDLFVFLREIAPIIDANVSSLERKQQVKSADHMRRLASGSKN